MRKIVFIFIATCQFAIAQEVVTVTAGPSKETTEVKTTEGIRIRTTDDKTGDAAFNHVLVTNAQGDIRKMNKDLVVDAIEAQIEIDNQTDMRKLFYLGNLVDVTKTLPIDNFVFYFSQSAVNGKFLDINMKLASQPSSNRVVHYTFFRKYNNYNNGWQSSGTTPTAVASDGLNQKTYSITSKTFTTTNWNTGQKIHDSFDVGDVGEMYVSFPGEAYMYRIVFYSRQNAATLSYNMQKNYTILVEKFLNTTESGTTLP